MSIQEVKAIIENILASDGARDELQSVLDCFAEEYDASPDRQEIRNAADFVEEYIRQVPYWLTVACTASQTMSLEQAIQTVLATVYQYWRDPYDLIPDRMGLLGLLDDAYFSMRVLQEVSDHFRLQTGKHLLPADLNSANKAINRLIGEPYASELDRIATRNLDKAELLEALAHMTEEEKRKHLEHNSTIWNHDSTPTLDSSSLDDIASGGT